MSVDLFSAPLLLILATALVLAHVWHRRRFPTAPISYLPDGASEGPPLATAVSSRNRAPFDVLYPDPASDTDKESAQAEVSIVAVHGLDSNIDWSWTWQDKAQPGLSVNWLKDPCMLPRKVPKSRIMVYNYDSIATCILFAKGCGTVPWSLLDTASAAS
ncbi:hypothetical protein B0J13DRAFT_631254 [Dactylonectria estremocensis]|uniref:Uncharacterized protein n=1 Tax=Dactylonectria estremocensis TaxID=1079267 RepID=A0A9P9I9K3_9HYPO|nr:hypothetical protein B0J13DRAFT_631254 [Dactylonectria estremocensis]